MWTSARRGLVEIVDEWSGLKCSAKGGCGWVDLFATAVWKSGKAKSRWESVEKRKRGRGQMYHSFALLLLLESAVELVSWRQWRDICWHHGQLNWNCWTEGKCCILPFVTETFGLLFVIAGRVGRNCSAALQFRVKMVDWTVDFGLLLLTSGVLHSHTVIIWGQVEWCNFEGLLRMKRRENKGKSRHFVGNLVALWQSNVDCGWWESARDNVWLERMLLFGKLFVESGGVEIVNFLRVTGWCAMILVSCWR